MVRGGTLGSSVILSVCVYVMGVPSPSGLPKPSEGAACPVSGLETDVGPGRWLCECRQPWAGPVRERGGGVPACPPA